MALGVPYNVASYAALLMIIAQQTGFTPRHFIHSFGDAHIYLNHIDGVKEQLTRQPKTLPQLTIANKPIDDLVYEDFTLTGYDPDPAIKFQIAV